MYGISTYMFHKNQPKYRVNIPYMDGSDPGQKKTIGWIDLLLSNSRGFRTKPELLPLLRRGTTQTIVVKFT